MLKPACKYGYTNKQVTKIIGTKNLGVFNRYMTGKTMAVCDGKVYNPETNQYEASNCGPHGLITYSCDVESFLDV